MLLLDPYARGRGVPTAPICNVGTRHAASVLEGGTLLRAQLRGIRLRQSPAPVSTCRLVDHCIQSMHTSSAPPACVLFPLTQGKHDWLLTSTYFMELLAGVAMLIIGTLLVLFRWTELRQVGDICRLAAAVHEMRFSDDQPNTRYTFGTEEVCSRLAGAGHSGARPLCTSGERSLPP